MKGKLQQTYRFHDEVSQQTYRFHDEVSLASTVGRALDHSGRTCQISIHQITRMQGDGLFTFRKHQSHRDFLGARFTLSIFMTNGAVYFKTKKSLQYIQYPSFAP